MSRSPDPTALTNLGQVGDRAVLIVGYGSTLRSDDAVGPVVARRIESDARFAGCRVRAEHQLAPELALDVRDAALVVLVDAATDAEAGEVRIREVAAAGDATRAWTHHIEPEALVALSRQLWGSAPSVSVVSVGIASLDVGDGLTPVVAAAVPKVVDTVAGIVSGHPAGRCPGA